MNDPFEKMIGKVEIDGHEVARFRKMRGLTPEALARGAVVGQKTVERWEAAGVCLADIDNVRKVTQILAIGLHEVLTLDFRQKLERNASPSKGRLPTSGPAEKVPAFRGLFQLPKRLGDFVGREAEIEKIVERFRSDDQTIGISALRGMGGVGKTTIAVHVAHLVKDQFPDAQLFLDLQGVAKRPMTWVEAMVRFIRDLHPTALLPDSEGELLPIYRSTFAKTRALIVLDNAGGETQVKNLITGEKNGFIVTSRRALALEGVPSIRIDDLSPDNALTLLRGIVGAKGTDGELRTVAELCGCLPLALRVAGDFLRLKVDWTVSRYTTVLQQEKLRWLRPVGDDKEKDVEAVLKMSSAQLVRDNADLAVRWHHLSDWPSDFGADAAAAAWDHNPHDPCVLEDLSELVGRSMVLYDEGTARYRLHDLMKPIAAGLFS